MPAEGLGGLPLLGVRGTVLITHGSAKRRMIWYGMEATARTVRERVQDPPAPERFLADDLAGVAAHAGTASASAPIIARS